ncbi:MAG: cache domain-containing protein [Desulfatibacillum sp.]|nr:cache domain-containing protein [Desulfatibacillum sp.]
MDRLVCKILWIGWVFAALACIGSAWAADNFATKDECVEQCKKAAEYISQVGIDKALEVMNDPKGPFVWKDSYVFVADTEQKINIAHPVKPALNNKAWVMTVKDVNGKMFFAEFMETALSPGEGWVHYMWPKPGEQEPVPKSTYIYRVPGTPYATGAGIYDNPM